MSTYIPATLVVMTFLLQRGEASTDAGVKVSACPFERNAHSKHAVQ